MRPASRIRRRRSLYDAADMSKPADIRAMVKKAETGFGKVDILVNNAGIQHVAPVENFPPDKWDAIIAINSQRAFHTMRRGDARHEEARLGPHRQHRLGPRAGGIAVKAPTSPPSTASSA